MKKVIEKQLPLLEKKELLTGQVQYAVPGLAEQAYQQGARALITTVCKVEHPWEDLLNIFRLGMLPLKERNTVRLPNEADDVLYTQMVLERDIRFSKPFKDTTLYQGLFRIFFSLEILERGSYQYPHDNYGNRAVDQYKNRDNIVDFTQKVPQSSGRHEIMIKKHIDPRDIKGIWIYHENLKPIIIDKLRAQGFIQKDPSGQETINDIPLNEFIHAGDEITPAMVRHCAPK